VRPPLPRRQQGRVLADWVTSSLREAITNGYFEPGEKLDQDRIAVELQVSRTPVREALRRLQADGFVDIRPHYGAFIHRVSQDEIREVFEVRAVLETEMVRQVTPVIPEVVVDELDRWLSDSRAQLEVGNITKHFETDVHFHETLLNSVQNGLLKEMLDSLTNRLFMVRRLAQSKPGPHIPESLQEHRGILRAIRARDADRAAALMNQHLQHSSQRIQELAG
jgi:DNA-binding GntR family transcriptional regulator